MHTCTCMGLCGYLFFQIDIFATIRMVLKRVKNVHSNGVLIIILSYHRSSFGQYGGTFEFMEWTE